MSATDAREATDEASAVRSGAKLGLVLIGVVLLTNLTVSSAMTMAVAGSIDLYAIGLFTAIYTLPAVVLQAVVLGVWWFINR